MIARFSKANEQWRHDEEKSAARLALANWLNGREEKDMDFIHTYSGSEVDEIPSFEPQVIDSKERLPRKPSPLRLISTEHNFEEIIGESPALKRTLKQVEIVAPTDSTVPVSYTHLTLPTNREV